MVVDASAPFTDRHLSLEKDAVRIVGQPSVLEVIEAPVVALECPAPGLTVNTGTLIATSEAALESLARDSHYEEARVCAEGPPRRGENGVSYLPSARVASPRPDNTYFTACGATNWHLIAMGHFPANDVQAFLRSAATVPDAQLRRDLWEYSGKVVFPVGASGVYMNEGGFRGWPERTLQKILSFKTPLEIACMSGRPFLAGVPGALEGVRPLPPVLELMEWSRRLLS